eukprot:gene10220-13750_t
MDYVCLKLYACRIKHHSNTLIFICLGFNWLSSVVDGVSANPIHFLNLNGSMKESYHISYNFSLQVYRASGFDDNVNDNDLSNQILGTLENALNLITEIIPSTTKWEIVALSVQSPSNEGLKSHKNILSISDDDHAESFSTLFTAYSQLNEEEAVTNVSDCSSGYTNYFSALRDTMTSVIRNKNFYVMLSKSSSVWANNQYYTLPNTLSIDDSCQISNSVNSFSYKSSLADNDSSVDIPLRLFLLGDWGKGGVYGDITSSSSGSYQAKGKETRKRYLRHEKVSDFNLEGNNKVSYTYQYAVAKSMSYYAQQYAPISAIITLGDNFYTNGVQSTNDALWTSLWSSVYSFNSLNYIPWYATLGNHDWGYGLSGALAQVNRVKDFPNGDWKMPHTNYSIDFDIYSGGRVRVVFIDTTTLAPSENGCCNEKGGVSTSVQADRIINQLINIEQMLREAWISDNNPVTCLLVAGHYPVFSSGEHGDISELNTYLLPLLEKYNVTAYLSGHDHISEHLQ